MYCPNCELEIKGEGKERCPICDTILVENPFENLAETDELSDSEMRLKELIRDIDAKVSQGIESTPEDQVFTLDEAEPESTEPQPSAFELKLEMPDASDNADTSEEKNIPPEPSTSEPLTHEFDLHLDDAKSPVIPESAEENMFSIPERESSEPLQSSEPVFDLSKALESDTTQSESPLHQAINQTEEKQPEVSPDMLGNASQLEDTVEISRFKTKPTTLDTDKPSTKDSIKTTKEILNKALKELESPKPLQPQAKKKSLAAPVVIGALLLAIVISGGIYMLNYMQEPQTTPSLQKPKQAVPIKKARHISPSQQTVVTDNKTMPQDTGTSQTAPRVASIETPFDGKSSIQQPLHEVQKTQEPASQSMLESTSINEIAQPQKTPEQPAAPAKQQPVHEFAPKLTVPPAASPAQKSSVQQKPLPGTFSIHAGSYRTKNTAEQESRRFTAQGLDAYVEKVDLGQKGEWYRVKIGVFETQAQAENALRKFLSKEPGDARIVKNK